MITITRWIWPLAAVLAAGAALAHEDHPPEAPDTTAPATAPSPPPEMPAEEVLRLWDDNGNGRITCAEARRHGIAPVRHDHPAYPFMRDADGDGMVCE